MSFLALLAMPARAQTDTLKGRIIDAITKKPVPYATIEWRPKPQGVLGFGDGLFRLAVPADVAPDSLAVVGVGYARKTIAYAPSANQDLTIELNRKQGFLTDGSLLVGEPKIVLLGSRSTKPGAGMIQGMPGTQYALLCKNDKDKKLGFIRSVSFYIAENGLPRAQFRVRLYRADGAANGPASDMLSESIMASAAAGGQWFTVDLTSYTIRAPKEGFYVAMEWVPEGHDRFAFIDTLGPYTPHGQVLRPTFEFKESRTWNYTIGRGWSLITLASNGARYNVMIRAEVEAY